MELTKALFYLLCNFVYLERFNVQLQHMGEKTEIKELVTCPKPYASDSRGLNSRITYHTKVFPLKCIFLSITLMTVFYVM